MGIEKFIQKVCVQTAVYWGNPTPDGMGTTTFDDPVEISCRWDNTAQYERNSNGIEFVAKAKVLVTQDLDVGGWLFLGDMTGLDSTTIPMNVAGAFMIGKITKIPMIKKTNVFVRTVYLGYPTAGQ